jgi:hypothetical protein
MAANPTPVTPAQRDAFYAAAVAGLRALDARERTPRRFGSDADARWASFKGNLHDGDRLDLLLRDAAVTWGVAFSPAEAFDLFGLAPDEPLGPDWRTIGASSARRAFQEPPASTTPNALASHLGLSLTPITPPSVTPSTRLVVAGAAALAAVAEAFARSPGLSWSDQVLAVATAPAHRQLAGLLAIAVAAHGRTRLVRPSPDLRATLKEAGFAQMDVAVVSSDAEPACAEFARRAAGVA